MKAEDFLNQGIKPAEEDLSSKGMSAEAFLGLSAEGPIGEPAAGPAPLQGQPPTMLGRSKEAVADFFRPSFAPEPTGIEQEGYGAAMTRPISTITGQPVPTPEERMPGGITEPGKFDFMDRAREVKEEGFVPFVPFVSGIKEVKDIAKVSAAAHRLKKGTATPEERADLLEFVEKANRDTTFGYKVLDTVAAMPAFMGEFLLTSGIYTAGQKVGTKAATKTLKNYLGKTGGKLLEKDLGKIGVAVAGGVAGGTLQAPIMGAPRIVSGTIERSMPKLKLSKDEQDNIDATIAGEGEDLLVASTKALGDQWAETVSEHSGGLFKMLGGSAKNAAIRAGLFSATMKANPGMSPNQVNTLFNKMAYHGVINEMMEERVGEGLRAGLGVQEYKLPTAEQLAVELVAFSVPGTIQALGAKAFEKKPPAAPSAAPHLSQTQRDLAKEVILDEVAKGAPVPAIFQKPIPTVSPMEIVPGGPPAPALAELPPGQGFGLRPPEARPQPFSAGLAKDLKKPRALPPGQGFGLRPPEARPRPFSAGLAKDLKKPRALPPGQGFEFVEPKPETKLRPGPEKVTGREYPEGAEYVAGKPAPEELKIEHKPVLSPSTERPWKYLAGAEAALASDALNSKGISADTHKIVEAPGGGHQIVRLGEKGVALKRDAGEKVKGKTLISFVRAMGGIKDATLPGEVRALSGEETGVVGLTSSKSDKGLGFDEMASAAVEHGWLPEGLEDEAGAFSELLRDDVFAQKEGKPRIERTEDVAEKAKRDGRQKEFDQAKNEELEYFAKHPDEVIDADLDEWQKEAVADIRSRNEADAARKIEESVRSEVEAKNSDLEGFKGDEGFPEYIEGWSEKDLLDEDALAELEAWRAGEEVEKSKAEVPAKKPEAVSEKKIVVEPEKPKEPKISVPSIVKAVDEAFNARAKSKVLIEEGQKAVSGIRPQDAEEAGQMAYLVAKGEATQKEFDDWIQQVKVEKRIIEPKKPRVKAVVTEGPLNFVQQLRAMPVGVEVEVAAFPKTPSLEGIWARFTEVDGEILWKNSRTGAVRNDSEMKFAQEFFEVSQRPVSKKPAPKKPTSEVSAKPVEGKQLYEMRLVDIYQDADVLMSEGLRDLHNHRARVKGFSRAGGSFVEGYLNKLADVAAEIDMNIAMAASGAMSLYRKGDLVQASLEAEKALGALHRIEREALTPGKIAELHKQAIKDALVEGKTVPEKVLAEYSAKPEVKEKPRPEVKKAKSEESIASFLSSKKKAGVNYKMQVKVAETGEVVTVTKDAAVALRETKEELSRYEKFLECLTS